MTDKDILTLAEIRQVLGIGDEVMLADLLETCKKIKERADYAMIFIGDFSIYRNHGQLWLRAENGDAMAMNPDTEKRFEKMLLEFFKENF